MREEQWVFTSMASITAIVPTYNRAEYLAQAVNALWSQTRRPDDIIVWDDGSVDGTATVARELGDKIRYFRSDNGGKSRALNAAMGEARGDLIWICDDDDLALPDAAETLAGMLEAAPDAGVAGGSYRRFQDRPDGRRDEQGPGYWPDLSSGVPIRHLLEDIFLFQNATLVRRDLYDRAGPFREDLARSIDYDMIIRLGTLAPIRTTDKPLFLQRKHDGDRGPAAARHAAVRSDVVWKAADRAIFSDFRNRIPLGFYEAMFLSEDPAFVCRAALLQRACVHARRTDWPAALEDFRAATGVAPETSLGTLERAICRRAMAGKHGIEEVLVPEIRQELAALGRVSRAGASMTRALARGLAWRAKAAVKEGDLGATNRILRLTFSLLSTGRQPGGDAPTIRECRDLPAAAFLTSWQTPVQQGSTPQ